MDLPSSSTGGASSGEGPSGLSPKRPVEYSGSSTDDDLPNVAHSARTKRYRYRAVYSDSEDELGLNSYEEESGLSIDSRVLPFLRKVQNSRKGHTRTGQTWTLVEEATVLIGLSEKLLEKGNTPLTKRVAEFLSGRPGWNLQRRSVANFMAKMYKRARQGPI